MLPQLSGLQLRQTLSQALNFCLVLTTAYMFWKGLSVVCDSPSPIVVVLSGSMEPAFQRGDILFLWNRDSRVKVGDIVVYNVKGRDIPIVHRVVRNHVSQKKQLLLTKGDNNAMDDVDLYAYRQYYLDRNSEVVGAVKGYIPLVGYVTILLSENVWAKYALLGGMGLLAMVQRE
ncbi:uncharacterized protein V2V93DRAFT_364430 [Kockiozyma suomiensis]|uniref:uncharacterized protein n=1 Tax=Kockiozyma suomiensis TaxID=1337062 RepID=UPI0033430883